jgi:hypothetical protein
LIVPHTENFASFARWGIPFSATTSLPMPSGLKRLLATACFAEQAQNFQI